MATLFALCYRPGPAWLPGKSVFEQPLEAHRAYMQSLVDAGTVVIGGPYKDDTGGLVAVDAESREHALKMLASDPAIEAGIMLGEVHPWLILGGRAAEPSGLGKPSGLAHPSISSGLRLFRVEGKAASNELA